MRTIERTHRFKRDYRRESRGHHGADLDERLAAIVQSLATDAPLEPRLHDHALSGPWTDFRDCRVRPDRGLIDQKPDAGTLRLVRIGSNAELGLRRRSGKPASGRTRLEERCLR